MERTIEFNTGRYYAPEGQRIIATEFGNYDDIFNPEGKDDQYVIFEDLTRHVKGKIFWCELNEYRIMENYDKGNYEQV